MRHLVWVRDAGVCSTCGVDTAALRRAFGAALEGAIEAERRLRLGGACLEPGIMARAVRARARDLGYPPDRREWWDAHHVHEHADGGPDDLGNLATVCLRCHPVRTAEYAATRAARRKWAGERKPSRHPIPQRLNPWPPKGARPMRSAKGWPRARPA